MPPVTLAPTAASLKPFIERRRSGGITRRELAEIQLERAKTRARGEEIGGLWKDYGKSLRGSLRTEYQQNRDVFSERLQGAAAILERAPEYQLRADLLLPQQTHQSWKDYIEAVSSDGVFTVAEAREAIKGGMHGDEQVELLLSVAGIATARAEEVLAEEIISWQTRPADLTRTIKALEARVESLESKVATLERENVSKKRDIDRLVSQIEDRRAELEREYERKRTMGMIFAIFGAPTAAFVSLIAMQNDDARLRQLTGTLEARRAEQTRIATQLAAYEQVAVPAREVLVNLKAAAVELRDVAIPVRTPSLARFAEPAARVNAGTKLMGNLMEQIAVLQDLRDRAGSLNGELDAMLARLHADLDAADRMVEASRQELFELIQLALAPDPEAAARKLVEKKGKALIKKLQRELGLDIGVYVKDLVKKAFPEGGPAAELLRREIMAGLRN